MLNTSNNQDYFKQKRYVAYLTAGLGNTVDIAQAIVAGGADILEVGVPFSDPILDGPVIQQAMQQALASNINLIDIIQLCREIKTKTAKPIVLFSYYNPIYQLGEEFYRLATQANIDATLIVDLPFEEQTQHLRYSQQHQIGTIQLIAPNTPVETMRAADRTAPLFHYYACRAGTTGIKTALPDDFKDKIKLIRANTSQPLVAGFGISDGTMAAACCQVADGFVVGSRLVKSVLDGCSIAQLTAISREIAVGKGKIS